MDATEYNQRTAVLDEAMSWLGTPYHHAAFVRGAGVDCAFFLICVFHAAKLIEWFDPRPYPPDWHLHRDAERYLEQLMKHTRELGANEAPKPGDIVTVRIGRSFSHGAIISKWPEVIHAVWNQSVMIDDLVSNKQFDGRPMRFFSMWGRA
jgi:cell wall-associated NlpC family hydrolase